MQRKMWDQIVSGAGASWPLCFCLVRLPSTEAPSGRTTQRSARTAERHFPAARGDDSRGEEPGWRLRGCEGCHGPSAEAFSDHIGLHLEETNEGKTYSETSSEARAEGLSEKEAAELSGMADSLFKDETLRAMLLNAYGWWTVSSLVIFAGYGLLAAGALLALLAILGFIHARKVS